MLLLHLGDGKKQTDCSRATEGHNRQGQPCWHSTRRGVTATRSERVRWGEGAHPSPPWGTSHSQGGAGHVNGDKCRTRWTTTANALSPHPQQATRRCAVVWADKVGHRKHAVAWLRRWPTNAPLPQRSHRVRHHMGREREGRREDIFRWG